MTWFSVLDLAGGASAGGSGRFREQFAAVAHEFSCDRTRVIGLKNRLTAEWLAERELLARGADRVVAANNVGFIAPTAERWVLLRNANHFLYPDEWDSAHRTLTATFRAQTPIVRKLAAHADVVVVPSTSMARRVIHHLPDVEGRTVIRFHPLNMRIHREPDPDEAVILCPIVSSPYKDLGSHLKRLVQTGVPQLVGISGVFGGS